MKLKTYLSENELTEAAFGARIGVTQSTISKYVKGSRTPRPNVMARIHEATAGLVTANDFLQAAPEPALEAA